MVPALIEEFAAGLSQMPIAFLPGPSHPAAVFVTGVRPGTNLFVTAEGQWTGSYVPAYLRRYPFIMGDVPNGDPVLCVDASFEGLNEDKGEALFSKSGEIEEPVRQALALAENYRIAAGNTEAFCAKLHQLGLFRTVTLDAKLGKDRSSVVHGLLIVDEEAFDALPAETIAELHKDKFLKPIHAHLFSLASLNRLGEMAQSAEGETAAA